MAGSPNGSGEISDFKLKVSYWYVTHKIQLKKAFIGLLIALNVGLYGYSIVRAVIILVVEGPAYRQLLNQLPVNLIDYSAFRSQNSPDPLDQSLVQAIPTIDDQYNFVLKLTNPNPKYVAQEVVVQLVSDGSVIDERRTFVYPEQSNYVMFFNQKVSPTNSQLVIASVDWRRILNFSAFAAPRLNFEITDVLFIPPSSSGFGNTFPASTLQFKIRNATAYSYWQVGVYMLLYGGDGVGGINYLALDQFRAGETRTVEMRWLENLPPITGNEIVPEVDIFDAAAYMPIQ